MPAPEDGTLRHRPQRRMPHEHQTAQQGPDAERLRNAMAQLTISDAARACRVARSTLQRAINAGRLSLVADHQVDTAELLRAGYALHAARQEELQDAAERSTPT